MRRGDRPRRQPRERLSPASASRWRLVIAVSVANGLAWLNVSELTPALPTIQRAFDATLPELQWISSLSFTLALTALLIAGGRLGDVHGHRRVLGLGLLLFSAASVMAALAPGAEVLIVARGLQGVGAAVLLTTTLALIAANVAPERRGLAVGVYGALATVFQGVGPLVGGALASWGVWRLIFWLGIPLAGLTWWVIAREAADAVNPDAERNLDPLAIVAIVAWAGALTLVLTYGSQWGWSSPPALACYAVTTGGLGGLVLRELHARSPLVDLRLFRNPLFSGAVLLLFVANLAEVALIFLLALYFQNVLGYSALAAGALFLPATTVAIFAGPLAGRAFDRLGPRPPNVAAIALLGAGTVGVALATRSAGGGVEQAGLIAFGMGSAISAAATGASIVQAVSPEREGTGAGVLNFGAMLASTLGLAIAGPVFAASSDHTLGRLTARAHIPITRAEVGHSIALLSGSGTGQQELSGLSNGQRAEVTRMAKRAFRDGAFYTLLPFGVVCLVSIIPATLTQRRRWFFVAARAR